VKFASNFHLPRNPNNQETHTMPLANFQPVVWHRWQWTHLAWWQYPIDNGGWNDVLKNPEPNVSRKRVTEITLQCLLQGKNAGEHAKRLPSVLYTMTGLQIGSLLSFIIPWTCDFRKSVKSPAFLSTKQDNMPCLSLP
jgi:hypothetical protein